MRVYSKEKEKFNFNLRMYSEESFDTIIPFQKKLKKPQKTDVLINGFQYFHTLTKNHKNNKTL